MSMQQKFRAYWRLIFLVPVAAYVVCLVDLEHNQPTQGTTWLASVAVLFFMVHLFRLAIGGALVLAEHSETPLRMNLPPAPAPIDAELERAKFNMPDHGAGAAVFMPSAPPPADFVSPYLYGGA